MSTKLEDLKTALIDNPDGLGKFVEIYSNYPHANNLNPKEIYAWGDFIFSATNSDEVFTFVINSDVACGAYHLFDWDDPLAFTRDNLDLVYRQLKWFIDQMLTYLNIEPVYITTSNTPP